jgi:alpha-amylase
MPDPTSIRQIDLSPVTGKVYSDLHRDWREEVIYFLMTDRFHDSAPRQPRLQPTRSQGFATPELLRWNA